MTDRVVMVRSIRTRHADPRYSYQIDTHVDNQVQVILMDPSGFHLYQAQSGQHPSEKTIDQTIDRLIDRIEDEFIGFATKE